MKSILFALGAMLMYTTTNLIIEQKLSKFPVSIVMVGMNCTLLFSSVIFFCYQLQGGTATVKLFTDNWAILLTLGALYFVGDFFLLNAYHAKGSVMTIPTILALMPICASFAKYFLLKGEAPNMYQIAAYVLALLAVITATKGNLLQNSS